MPQMAPMWWTMIYMSTVTMLLMMMIMMYFQKSNSMKTKSINFLKKNKNWKW
uniref:ATP synthase F0 subunit 8 n=1 Tax=Tingis cardui TaxID=1511256 RepID=A0A343WNQ2_9HEMI|nr:ATP synthase F0 subunit 8 [Tingis cardui]AWD31628.1 ATP synthase F0 subunit 8 [Tingis cardui]